MKKIFTLLCLCFLSMSVFANTASVSSAKNTQVLFVMLAKEATLDASAKPNHYLLTLKGTNGNVVYFANRPARLSGHISLNEFIAQWHGNGVFHRVAPNAMMEAVNINAKTEKLQQTESSYPIVLKSPVFPNNKDASELVFDVTLLPGSKIQLPKKLESDYVAIFVDSVCLSCIG